MNDLFRRRAHPARQARRVIGATSGATYVALTASIGVSAYLDRSTEDEAQQDPVLSEELSVGSDTTVPAALALELAGGATPPDSTVVDGTSTTGLGTESTPSTEGANPVSPQTSETSSKRPDTTVQTPTAPSSTSPSSQPPSTQPSATPSSVASSSTVPTSQPMTSDSSTEPPNTGASTTAPPATQPPTTQPPATQPPTTQPPTTEATTTTMVTGAS